MKTYKVWLTCLVDIEDNTTTENLKNYIQENLNQTGSTEKILGTYKATDLYCEDVYDIVEHWKSKKKSHQNY